MKKILAFVLVLAMALPCLAMAEDAAESYVYKDSVTTLATNWNPHTYQTEDDSYPADFMRSGLYTFVFNDELHPVEGKEPYTGYKINTYRTVKDAEGNTLSTTLEATSNYAVANRIIIVGAGTDVAAAAGNADSFVPVEIPEEALTNDGQPVTVTAEDIAGDE